MQAHDRFPMAGVTQRRYLLICSCPEPTCASFKAFRAGHKGDLILLLPCHPWIRLQLRPCPAGTQTVNAGAIAVLHIKVAYQG